MAGLDFDRIHDAQRVISLAWLQLGEFRDWQDELEQRLLAVNAACAGMEPAETFYVLIRVAGEWQGMVDAMWAIGSAFDGFDERVAEWQESRRTEAERIAFAEIARRSGLESE